MNKFWMIKNDIVTIPVSVSSGQYCFFAVIDQ